MYPDISFIDKLKQLLLTHEKERYWSVDDLIGFQYQIES